VEHPLLVRCYRVLEEQHHHQQRHSRHPKCQAQRQAEHQAQRQAQILQAGKVWMLCSAGLFQRLTVFLVLAELIFMVLQRIDRHQAAATVSQQLDLGQAVARLLVLPVVSQGQAGMVPMV
jgi:hypothetical protein